MRTYVIVAVALDALLAISMVTSAHACEMLIQPGAGYKYVCPPPTPGRPGPGGSSIKYGAIAYSPTTGLDGYSDNYPDKAQADQRALSECGQADCVVATWFYDNCGALATADNGAWGAEVGGSEARARSLALARCGRQGGDHCQIKISHCSGG
jgi:hypothetical protein